MFDSNKFRLSFLFILITAVTVSAQVFGDRSRTGGTGGVHTILGRIYFPSGRPKMAFRVRLESTNSSTLMAYSNLEGVFVFNSLEPGNYTIVVETEEIYEPVRETLTIDRENDKTARTFNLIIYLTLKGNPKAKPAVINAKLAQVPKNALEQYQKGLQLSAENNHQKAIQHLNKAVELYPNFDEALSELGAEYLIIGELEKAFHALQRALAINEENLNARLNYGIVLLNKKQMTEAETELRKVIAKKDELAVPRLYLGIALIGLKRIDEAETELKKAISLKKGENLGQAHRYLGGIYWQKNDYQQAVEHLEKYLEYYPKAADAERIRTTIKDLRAKM